MTDQFLDLFYPGQAPAIQKVRRSLYLANQPAAVALRQPVLFLGEPGTGKNFAAKITAANRVWLGLSAGRERELYTVRAKQWEPLIITKYAEVLLPGIPHTLIESELFGHVRGAFTGAERDYEGVFGSAGIQDVLLDEIGDAGLLLQEKLLEVLESGAYRPIGANLYDKAEASARVLMATNRDLASLVETGDFREDLYWRISQLVVHIPPLREQRENIPAIMENIRASLANRPENVEIVSQLQRRRFESEDVTWAGGYEWPGNVRELVRLIRLWLIHPEALRLQDIHAEFPIADPRGTRRGADVLLSDAVRRWCDEVVDGRRARPSNLDELMQQFTNVIRSTLANGAIRPDQVGRLVSDQRPENVRSRISKWRGG